MEDILKSILGWIGSNTGNAINRLTSVALILVVGVLAIYIVTVIVNKALEKSRLEKAAHSLIKSVIRAVLWSMLGLIVVSSLGIDITGIVALASVATLAVSLALQNSLANLIGGFTLLNTKPFKSGDYVEIAGQSGTVQEIGMAYTKLTTPDNKLTYIPNSAVVAAEIVNYTVTGTRRVDVTVNAAYTTSIEDMLKALREAGDVPQKLEDKDIFAAVTKYGESSIEYSLRVWCRTEDYWTVWFAMNSRVKEIMDREGLKMTYPHLNIHVER